MKNRNKFRGKCAFCGTWYYGGVYGESFIVNVSEEDIFKSFKYCKEDSIGRLLGEDYAGNEVYEGDVVELKAENDDVAKPYIYERWEIYFDEKCWRYHFRNKEKIYDDDFINFEQMVKDFQIRVIGNVFDNPELLDEPISEGRMDKEETVKIDKFENIRKHWQNIPYDEDLPLAASSTGDISEETLEKLKEIAEEE